MKTRIVTALIDADGPTAANEVVRMLAGTKHVIRSLDVEFFLAHPAVFSVAPEAATIEAQHVIEHAALGNIPTYSLSATGEVVGLLGPNNSMVLRVAYINNVGVPGGQGFGVGICPSTLPSGMAEMSGTRDPSSANYGNYQYSDGSVMCWIPAFYYKFGTGSNGVALNDVAIKPESAYANIAAANADNYALHRAFYDGGAVQRGVFVDKYIPSNNAGKASSLANGIVLTSAQRGTLATAKFSALTGAPTDTLGGAFAASKTRGANFFPSSRFIWSALALLSYAHAKASSAVTYCAWYHATNNFPKGNNNNALSDADDATVTWTYDGNGTYLGVGKTGSASALAKSTHNGQSCGVADLNGLVWEMTPGLSSIVTTKAITGATQANPCVITATSHGIAPAATTPVMITGIVGMTELNAKMFTATGIDANTLSLNVDSLALTAYSSGGTLTIPTFYALNTAVAMKSITGSNTLATDHWGATGIAAMFTALAVPMETVYPNNGSAQLFGSGANQVLSEATSGVNWTLTGLGLPKDANAVDTTGTSAFGKDYFYQSAVAELAPLSGGTWGDSSNAGVWCLNLNDARTDSGYNRGFRSALYL